MALADNFTTSLSAKRVAAFKESLVYLKEAASSMGNAKAMCYQKAEEGDLKGPPRSGLHQHQGSGTGISLI